MKIKVEDINAEGLVLDETFEPSRFTAVLEGTDVELQVPLKATLELRRMGPLIEVNGSIETTGAAALCSRCLKKYSFDVKAVFRSRLIHGSDGGAREKELTGDDLEVSYFEGEEIETFDVIAEQLSLELPVKPLCVAACKGLCPYCGADLNAKECDCLKKEKTDPRLEKLKGFKVK
ncbi:MAG: DUF177 domain-containing protein [Deltaproteobacteria bacterium]|nr:DUF177 domain-containing protein [Deltaproteobacteria bacterium]